MAPEQVSNHSDNQSKRGFSLFDQFENQDFSFHQFENVIFFPPAISPVWKTVVVFYCLTYWKIRIFHIWPGSMVKYSWNQCFIFILPVWKCVGFFLSCLTSLKISFFPCLTSLNIRTFFCLTRLKVRIFPYRPIRKSGFLRFMLPMFTFFCLPWLSVGFKSVVYFLCYIMLPMFTFFCLPWLSVGFKSVVYLLYFLCYIIIGHVNYLPLAVYYWSILHCVPTFSFTSLSQVFTITGLSGVDNF